MSLFGRLFSRSALPLQVKYFGEAVFVREHPLAADYQITGTAEAPRAMVEAGYDGDLTTRNLDWLFTVQELRKLPFELTQNSQIRRQDGSGLLVYMPTPNAAGAVWSPDDDDSLQRRYRCLFTGEESV